MPLSNADWQELRRLYMTGEHTITALSQRFNISTTTFYRRRQKENWQRPKGVRRASMVASPVTMKTLLAEALQDHIACQPRAEQLDAPDKERAARTLSSLVRTLEKLNDIDGQEATDNNEQPFPRDLAELRFELAQRLAKLQAATPANQPEATGKTAEGL
jgi:transposase-like protein